MLKNQNNAYQDLSNQDLMVDNQQNEGGTNWPEIEMAVNNTNVGGNESFARPAFAAASTANYTSVFAPQTGLNNTDEEMMSNNDPARNFDDENDDQIRGGEEDTETEKSETIDNEVEEADENETAPSYVDDNDGKRHKLVRWVVILLVLALFVALIMFVKNQVLNKDTYVTDENLPEVELVLPAEGNIENIPEDNVEINASESATTEDAITNNTADTTQNVADEADKTATGSGKVSTQQTQKTQQTQQTQQVQKTTTPTNHRFDGVVYFSGSMPNGAKIIVRQRELGKSDWIEIARIDAHNGSTWNWGGASAGKTYEVQYVLDVNGEHKRTSPTATATAPAHVEIKMFTGQD